MKRPWFDLVTLLEEYRSLTGEMFDPSRDTEVERRPGETDEDFLLRVGRIGSLKRLLSDHPRRFAQHLRLQPAVTALRRAHPGWSRHYVATLIGKKFKVSARTVRRNTFDPGCFKK